jgi:hypothetical protein
LGIFTRRSPQTLKTWFVSSTKTASIPDPVIAKPFSCESSGGRQIDFRSKQPEKASLPSVETFETLSNVTVARDLQLLKQEFPMISINEGMHIDVSEKQE